MAYFENKQQGAPRNPDDALKGEVLAALSDWSATYETDRLELAWTVLNMLSKHVERQGLDVYVEFCDRAGDILKEQSELIRQVFDEDRRRRAH